MRSLFISVLLSLKNPRGYEANQLESMHRVLNETLDVNDVTAVDLDFALLGFLLVEFFKTDRLHL